MELAAMSAQTVAFLRVSALTELLKEEQRRFKTKYALAKRIHISASRLGRAMKGEFSLEVVTCLRLARVTGRPASEVLRAADKGEIADLIEDMYGGARPLQLPADEDQEVLALWQRLTDDEDRSALLRLLRTMLGEKRPGEARAPRQKVAAGPGARRLR